MVSKLMNLKCAGLVLAALLAGGCTNPGTPPTGDPAVLEASTLAFYEAMNRDALDELTSLFSPDAFLHVAGMPAIHGSEAIGGFFANLLPFHASAAPTLHEVKVSDGGDLGFAAGLVTNRFESPGGSVEFQGKFILIWEHDGSDWRIRGYSTSSDND